MPAKSDLFLKFPSLTRTRPSSIEPNSRFWNGILALTLIGLFPFAAWLMGSAIVHISPSVYRSDVVIRISAEGSDSELVRSEAARLKSKSVVREAAETLAHERNTSADPMAKYLLWSKLSVEQHASTNLIRLVARSSNPEEAHRISAAVIEAYEAARPSGLGQSIYFVPVQSAPLRVADEKRMILGIAGLAMIGLLLSIPLLRRLERWDPLKSIGYGAFTEPATA